MAPFSRVKRSPKDEFILIASDGLFDVMSNDEACRFVKRNLITLSQKSGAGRTRNRLGYVSEQVCTTVATRLVQFALKKGSLDNVTAVIVMLHM